MYQNGEPRVRAAHLADLPFLNEMLAIAADDLPIRAWPGLTVNYWAPLWQHAWVVERQNRVVTMLIGSPMHEIRQEEDPSLCPAPLGRVPESSWHVIALVTLPGHRNRGLGHRLLAVAEGLARMAGSTSLSLMVPEHNIVARNFYHHEGFVPATLEPGHNAEPCVLMVKSLNGHHATVRPGRYQDWLGNEYEVVDVVNARENEEPLVLYRRADGNGGLWSCPMPRFTRSVNHSRTIPRLQLAYSEEPRPLAPAIPHTAIG